MKMTRTAMLAALCFGLAGCNLYDPRVGASVSVGSGGTSVSPYAGVSIGNARVGIGL